MNPAYFWTIVSWALGAIGFFGAGCFIVWGAFAPPVEDEEAAR